MASVSDEGQGWVFSSGSDTTRYGIRTKEGCFPRGHSGWAPLGAGNASPNCPPLQATGRFSPSRTEAPSGGASAARDLPSHRPPRVLDLQHPGRRAQGSAGPAKAPPTVRQLQVRLAATGGPTRVRSCPELGPRPVRGPPPRGEGTSFPPNPRSTPRAAARVRFFSCCGDLFVLCGFRCRPPAPDGTPSSSYTESPAPAPRPAPSCGSGRQGWKRRDAGTSPVPGEAPRPRGGLAAGAEAAHPGERGAPASPAQRTAPASPARAAPRRPRPGGRSGRPCVPARRAEAPRASGSDGGGGSGGDRMRRDPE